RMRIGREPTRDAMANTQPDRGVAEGVRRFILVRTGDPIRMRPASERSLSSPLRAPAPLRSLAIVPERIRNDVRGTDSAHVPVRSDRVPCHTTLGAARSPRDAWSLPPAGCRVG